MQHLGLSMGQIKPQPQPRSPSFSGQLVYELRLHKDMIKVGILLAFLIAAASAERSSWAENLFKNAEGVALSKRSSLNYMFGLLDVNGVDKLLLMGDINREYGSYGYVYGEFDIGAAWIACQEMGYKGLKSEPYRNRRADGTPILPDEKMPSAFASRVSCDIEEKHFIKDFETSCEFDRATDHTSTTTRDAVFLDCEERDEESDWYPQLLLAKWQGRDWQYGHEGLLVLQRIHLINALNSGEEFAATIDYKNFGGHEASLVCQKMGFSGRVLDMGRVADKEGETLSHPYFATGVVMRVQLNCTGSEEDLFDCDGSAADDPNHGDDVWINCEKWGERPEEETIPDGFHLLMPKPVGEQLQLLHESRFGVVLAEINNTLATICLTEQSTRGFDLFCEGTSTAYAMPAEWYFDQSDLEQFQTMTQYETALYLNKENGCNAGPRVVVYCTDGPEPTPGPEPNNTEIVLQLWNPVNSNPNEGIVVAQKNTADQEYGLLDWFDVALVGEYEEIICNTLGFSGVVESLPIAEYEGVNEEIIEKLKYYTKFIVDELRCPTEAGNISDCDPKLVEPDALRIAEDSLVIICGSKPTPSPKPVTPYTTPFPFTTPEPGPFPTSDNEVDLDFGGLNLKLILGRHRYRERF